MSVTPDTPTPAEPRDRAGAATPQPDRTAANEPLDRPAPAPAYPPRFPIAGAERAPRRPRGPLRHYGGFLLSPSAGAAMPLILERNRTQRLRRLAATTGERAGWRRRPTRARMRALTAAPGARLRWRSVPAPPAPGPDGALVRPLAIATCDIDCPLVLGATQLALPLQLGHECVGEVLSIGERVATVAPGDRVVVPFQINCGACASCRAGHTGNCLSVPPLSAYGMGVVTGHFGGALADQLAVPFADAMLVPLPAGVDPVAAASVADNLCDAHRHIAPHVPRLLEQSADGEILILAGLSSRPLFSPSTPLFAGLLARAFGARNVTLADSRAHVRAHAQRLGLHALTPRELRGHGQAPLVLHISDDPLATAIAHTAPDGVCSSTGSLHRHARIPILKMYVHRVSLHIGIPHARAIMPRVLELIADGSLPAGEVVSMVAPLDDAPEALREHVFGGGVKTVLTAY
ncbi:MAG TPA: alcohol dehydrogenase catalytic domain-containing protein [Solirubrobacteraceae bacterium]|nr:alcohol dehydrogenase catalytic domain-containing protein [Solirubrobacteraceae bacterium]